MVLTVSTEGLHPASILCLEALQWLHERQSFSNILEIGCGNGILTLTAASIWQANVTACDISSKAVEDTIFNIEKQKVSNISVVRSDGFEHALIRKNSPYDLIICNLLAELLVKFAGDIKKSLTSNGVILFSGILSWKTEETLRCYTNLNIEIIKEFSDSPWNCYVLCNKAKT
jgi:ribosomal protein L11 methyltransferase